MDTALLRLTKVTTKGDLTMKEVARILGQSHDMVRRLTKTGQVGGVQYSGTDHKHRHVLKVTRAGLIRYMLRTRDEVSREELMADISQYTPRYLPSAQRELEAIKRRAENPAPTATNIIPIFGHTTPKAGNGKGAAPFDHPDLFADMSA